MRRSIRTRLLITFIVLAAVPLLVVGTLLAYQAYTTQQAEALHNQAQEAAQVSTQVSAFFSELESQLNMVIHVRGINDLNAEQQASLLTEMLSQQSSFDNLAMIDQTGKETVRVSRVGKVSQENLVDRSKSAEFLTPFSDGKTFYGPVQVNATTGEPFMMLAIPIIDLRLGKAESVLVAQIRFKPVWDLVAQVNTGENDTVYILDAQTRVVAHPDPSVVLKGTQFAPAQMNAVEQGLSGNTVVLGSEQIQLGSQIFTVVAEQPAAEALALAVNAVLVTAVVILVAVVFALIAGIFTIRFVVRPIQSLAVTARAIAAGDLSQQVTIVSRDEIGETAIAFNNMTAQLRKTLDGLQQHVDELEKARLERERLIRELRESSRLKSEFLSTMSHELRTPLNAMIGFTELMLAGTAGALTDKQKHQLGRIHANSLRLLALIDDVLDLSRIEAGRVEIAHEPFAPRDMVAKVANQTSSLAEKKGLQFTIMIDDTLPSTLLGDQSRIEQVVINLLSNAFKFTEHGEVALYVKPDQDNQHWILSVRDTGIGIPPHALEYIFDEFRQVDGSSRRVYGGSGLGLAICRNLTRLMGGDVRVQSALGQGSTFTVALPLEIARAIPVLQPVAAATVN